MSTARYPYVLFDLDGTLADSGEGVLNCVKYALSGLGYAIPPQETLCQMVGPSLKWGFPNVLGVAPADVPEAIRLFRQRYAVEGLRECALYPAIADMLKTLHEAGCHLYVATCKPTAFSEIILHNLGIYSYFDAIIGSNLDNTRGEKPEVIAHLCHVGSIPAAQAVMIGDRASDIRGGQAFSMDTVGVTFGYGSEQEVREAGATHIAHSPADIVKFVLAR